MKKCSYCGKENSDEATMCAECGSALTPNPSPVGREGGTEALTPDPSPIRWERGTRPDEPWEKIAQVDNEAEAERLDVELSNQKITHVMRSYHDSALDGLYQFSQGWGEVEGPNERREEILSILKDIRAAGDEA